MRHGAWGIFWLVPSSETCLHTHIWNCLFIPTLLPSLLTNSNLCPWSSSQFRSYQGYSPTSLLLSCFQSIYNPIQHQNSLIFCLGNCKLFQPQTVRGFQALNILSKFTSTAVERTENFNCLQKNAVAQMYPLAFFILILQFQRKIMLKVIWKETAFSKCFDFSLSFFFKGNGKEHDMPVQTKAKSIDGLSITTNTWYQSFDINNGLEVQALFSLMWLL